MFVPHHTKCGCNANLAYYQMYVQVRPNEPSACLSVYLQDPYKRL